MNEEGNTKKNDIELNTAEQFEDREGDLDKLDDPALQLQEVIKERDEQRQNYLRALADLENIKKRTAKERSELLKYQGERIIFDLLEVKDNLDLALNQEETTLEELKTGLNLIDKMFQSVLEKWEVKAVSALGKKFNAEMFEAIGAVPDESEPDTVLQELKKAYNYKDRLLRVGQVVVSKKPEEEKKEE